MINIRNHAPSLVVVTAFALAACGAPSILDKNPDDFTTVASGRVAPSEVAKFKDCVKDEFDALQTASLLVREQRRSDGTRVEAVAGPHPFIIADIRDDGSTALLRGYGRAWFAMTPHQDAYKNCLTKFGTPTRS